MINSSSAPIGGVRFGAPNELEIAVPTIVVDSSARNTWVDA